MNRKRRRDREDPGWVDAREEDQGGKRHHRRDEAEDRLRRLEMELSGLTNQLEDLRTRHDRCILENQRVQNRNRQLQAEVRDDFRVAQALRANQQLRAHAMDMLQRVNRILSEEGVSRMEIQGGVDKLWTLFRGG